MNHIMGQTLFDDKLDFALHENYVKFCALLVDRCRHPSYYMGTKKLKYYERNFKTFVSIHYIFLLD